MFNVYEVKFTCIVENDVTDTLVKRFIKNVLKTFMNVAPESISIEKKNLSNIDVERLQKHKKFLI